MSSWNLKLQKRPIKSFWKTVETAYYLCSEKGWEVFEAHKYAWTFNRVLWISEQKANICKYTECVNFMIKMFLCCSHVIYICVSLIFIFLIIWTLDYPDYLPWSSWVWIIEVWLYCTIRNLKIFEDDFLYY